MRQLWNNGRSRWRAGTRNSRPCATSFTGAGRSLQEYKTTQLIRELLAGWGPRWREHPGLETGLTTALIRGRTPAPPSPCGEGHRRPAHGENTGLPFSSLPGGSLPRLRPRHPHRRPCSGPPRPQCATLGTGSHGSVKLIFQCAEEVGGRCGADAGSGRPGPECPEAVVGFHCDPKLPWDTVGSGTDLQRQLRYSHLAHHRPGRPRRLSPAVRGSGDGQRLSPLTQLQTVISRVNSPTHFPPSSPSVRSTGGNATYHPGTG